MKPVSEQISEVFNSDFSVLGIVQNGKLGVENLGKLILRGFRVFRELRVFDLSNDFGKIPRGRKLGVLGKLGTSEICSEVVSSNSAGTLVKLRGFPTPTFPFCTTLKTENSEMKTSKFSPTPSDQTPRFSISEFSARVFRFECSTKWKTRSWKTLFD